MKKVRVGSLKEANVISNRVIKAIVRELKKIARFELKDIAKEKWIDNFYTIFNTRISSGLEVTGEAVSAINIVPIEDGVELYLDDVIRRGSNYTKLLTMNVGPSEGRYIRKIDRRVKTGMHPGFRNTPRMNRLLKLIEHDINKELGGRIKRKIFKVEARV